MSNHSQKSQTVLTVRGVVKCDIWTWFSWTPSNISVRRSVTSSGTIKAQACTMKVRHDASIPLDPPIDTLHRRMLYHPMFVYLMSQKVYCATLNLCMEFESIYYTFVAWWLYFSSLASSLFTRLLMQTSFLQLVDIDALVYAMTHISICVIVSVYNRGQQG